MREREEKREKRRERRRAERRRQSVIPGRRQTKSHGKRESYERKHKLQACFGRPGLGATRRQEDEGENESPLCENHEVKLLIPLSFSFSLSLSLSHSLSLSLLEETCVRTHRKLTPKTLPVSLFCSKRVGLSEQTVTNSARTTRSSSRHGGLFQAEEI